jgi:MOSC domain-containing protein YiiM
MTHAYLESIQVGKPQSYGSESATDTQVKTWTSAIFKNPIEGPVFVGKTNLAGDQQADLQHHGGIDKAVLAYSADHYPLWRGELQKPNFPHGAFGENLTISGHSEQSMYIGDIFSVGSAIFEVSQPRQPCSKLARRWAMTELISIVLSNGRSGWYLRVLQEGTIDKGMRIILLDRPNPDWPVSRANHIMNHQRTDLELTMKLAAVPKLSIAWVTELRERADRLSNVPANTR